MLAMRVVAVMAMVCSVSVPAVARTVPLTPRSTLRVGVGQTLCLSGDRDGNLWRIERALKSLAADGADIAVFPETTVLGWDNPLAWSQGTPIPGPDTDRLATLARDSGIAIVVGLAERVNATTLHDSAVLIDRTGTLLHTHRKVNVLSSLMSPPYTPGLNDANNIAAVPLKLVDGTTIKVGVLICADTFEASILARMAADEPTLVAVPYGWSGCPAGVSNANQSHCAGVTWPAHGADLTQLVVGVANRTRAIAVGVDTVGQQLQGPWAGQTYGGFSTVAVPGRGATAVLADRDVEVRVVDVPLS